MSTTYNITDSVFFAGGRFSVVGDSQQVNSRNGFVLTYANGSTITFTLRAAVNTAIDLYIDDVLQSTITLVGTIGVTHTQTFTTALPNDGSYHRLQLTCHGGDEGTTRFVTSASVTTDGTLEGIDSFVGVSGITTELIGSTNGQTLGISNSTPISSGSLFTIGWTSPGCITQADPGLMHSRRAKCTRIGVVLAPGLLEAALYVDGVYTERWQRGTLLTNWTLAVFSTAQDGNYHTYHIICAANKSPTVGSMDEIVLFGSAAAFDTVAVSTIGASVAFGDSIDTEDDAATPTNHIDGAVWTCRAACDFKLLPYSNRSKAGNTIANINSQWTADIATITASSVIIGSLGVGENDAGTLQATFTSALTAFINNFFGNFTNAKALVIRGLVNSTAVPAAWISNAIAASSYASKVKFEVTEIIAANTDGQHPSELGQSQIYAAMKPFYQQVLGSPLLLRRRRHYMGLAA